MSDKEKDLFDLQKEYDDFLNTGVDSSLLQEWYDKNLSELQDNYGMYEGGLFKGLGGIDNNMVPLTSGEYIMPTDKTNMYMDELESMRDGSFNKNITISPAKVNMMLNNRVIGEAMIDFITDESDNGNVRINPIAIQGTI